MQLNKTQNKLFLARLFEYLEKHRYLPLFESLKILEAIQDDIDVDPYKNTMFDTIKNWYGYIEQDVFDTITDRLYSLDTGVAKSYCKIGAHNQENCQSAATLLGLKTPESHVDIKYELARHKLSTSCCKLNSKFSSLYFNNRSFYSFAFSAVNSAETDEEKQYAELLLCKYVKNSLRELGFPFVSLNTDIFIWSQDIDTNNSFIDSDDSISVNDSNKYLIELPSCIRFVDAWHDELKSAIDTYIASLWGKCSVF